MHRLSLAFRCFWLALTDATKADELAAVLKPPDQVGDVVPAGAVQLLSLLQREGRLIDFVNEDIDTYSDAQIGAAVRDIHRGCRQVLDEYVQVKPIVDQEEESRLEVPAGFDPTEIRLTGNVHGAPPFHGTLKHHGWRVRHIKFPQGVAENSRVIAPAEVEI